MTAKNKEQDLFMWAFEYDWVSDSRYLLIWATCLNVISLAAVLTGLIQINKCIKVNFGT